MTLIHPASLGKTVDAVNAAFFFEQTIPAQERDAAAAFIAARRGQPHAYANTFALFPAERTNGVRVFTGEKITCASARHIIGQEACRALRFLNSKLPAAKNALNDATTSLRKYVGDPAPNGPKPEDGRIFWNWEYRGGTYCCGKCSVGFWRNILAGSFDGSEARLNRGMTCLREYRSPDHQWWRFPFWYTVSALVEMPASAAVRDEMRHVAPLCEKTLQRPGKGIYRARRAEIARRLLAAV